MKDYYEILEVNKNASDDTIKKVFRILIKKNHPDLFTGAEKKAAEEKVKQLNEAYAVLSDKEKREKYDLELEEHNLDIALEIEILREENEKLKAMLHQKNNVVKEDNITNIFDNNYYNRQNSAQMQNDLTREAYNKYISDERIKRIIYIAFIVIVGIIAFYIMTGVNLLAVVFRVLVAMF